MKLPKDLQKKLKNKENETSGFKNKQEYLDHHENAEIFAYTMMLEEKFARLRIFGDERDLKFVQKCENSSKTMCHIPIDSKLDDQIMDKLYNDFDVSKINLDNYMTLCANCLKSTNNFLREFRKKHSKNSLTRYKEGVTLEHIQKAKQMKKEASEIIPFIKVRDHVKVQFVSLGGDKEYMWIDMIKISSDKSSFAGILLNDPIFEHKNLKKGDMVEFSSSRIYDVIFME